MTRDHYVTGQRPDWRGSPITPAEHRAFERGVEVGMRKAWVWASLIAGCAAVAVVALAVRAMHP